MSIIRGFEDLQKEDKKIVLEQTARKLPWASEVMANMGKTSSMVSTLLTWYQEENRKRLEGFENEVDLNDIKAALKGTINRWSNTVKENRLFFLPLLENKKIEWNKAKTLLSNGKVG